MVLQIKPGSVLRRGANKLTAAELKVLFDNSAAVDRIIEEIDARREVYLKTEREATDALKKLETAQEALAEGQAELAEDRAVFEAETAEAETKHKADMEALGRRTQEVADREGAATEVEATLGARELEAATTEAAIRQFIREINAMMVKAGGEIPDDINALLKEN